MSLVSRVSLIAVVTMGLSGVGFVGAVLAQNPHAGPLPASKMSSMPSSTIQRGHSKADMQAEQRKLDDLVAAMHAAKGAEKLDRMAAVVNELAARQTRMNARMMRMMQGGTMMKTQPDMTAPQPPPTPGSDHQRHHPSH
jgi:hypothetical protein